MSGPIIRKYGFPNFEKIFGERALEHGVENEEKPEGPAKPDQPAQAPGTAGSKPGQPAADRPTGSG